MITTLTCAHHILALSFIDNRNIILSHISKLMQCRACNYIYSKKWLRNMLGNSYYVLFRK